MQADTGRPQRAGTPSGVPRGHAPRHFVWRWFLAVALSVLVPGVVEYAVSARHLEQAVLEDSVKKYSAHVGELERVLAAPVTDGYREVALHEKLRAVTHTYGTLYAGLFDLDGRRVAATSGQAHHLHPDQLRAVAASGSPQMQRDEHASPGDEHRYELRFRVDAPAGPLVLAIDTRADIVRDLVVGLRIREALGLLAMLLLSVPLSYLLGGRGLHLRQRRAEHLADTDPLTNMLSRRPFRRILERELADQRTGPVALALIDIDNFKLLNDRLGHTHGDRVLIALADACVALRASDSAFRLGGDEFAIVLPDADHETAVTAVERVRNALMASAPGVTFSCGVAVLNVNEEGSQQELWERADAALYEAKRLGRQRTITFPQVRDAVSVSTDKLDAVLGLIAADGADLTAAFQPVWDLRQGGILGHEALVRLPAGAVLNGPAEAFALAQRLGLADALDAAARTAILASVATHEWEGLLFLNVHPDALPHLDAEVLARQVIAAGLEVSDVVLEVTEHGELDDERHVRVLKRARERGFKIALDDMGAGNAGLRALTHLTFDIIKIDRDVVARLGVDPAADATFAAAKTFAARTGSWLIAEGIEDGAMLAHLLDAHGRADAPSSVAAQGYLLGRPAPAPLDARTPLRDGAPIRR